MWTALLAFAGGVVAVALTGWVNYVFERRREQRELQVAARLVYEELWGAAAGISSDLFTGEIPAVSNFTESAWQAHKEIIAGALDFEHWRLVQSGYYSVADARQMAAEALNRTPSGEITRATEQVQFADIQHSIVLAGEIIADLIEGGAKDPFPLDRVQLEDETIEQWRREIGADAEDRA